jgi:hypothetical protein
MKQSGYVQYTIDKEQGLIITTAEGNVRFDDIKAHQDRLLADPDFDENFDQLIDTTGVTNIELSVRQVKVLAERRVVSPESRRAMVAPEPHIFGLGRMMEVYHQPFGEAQVFRSRHEALQWIGIEEVKTSGA